MQGLEQRWRRTRTSVSCLTLCSFCLLACLDVADNDGHTSHTHGRQSYCPYPKQDHCAISHRELTYQTPATMDTDTSISTENITHYIFQTPKTVLASYNANNPLHPPTSTIAIRIFVLFEHEILVLKNPAVGKWVVLGYTQGDLNNSLSIADRSYQALGRTGVNLRNPQIMEPAFREPALEGPPARGNDGIRKRKISSPCPS